MRIRGIDVAKGILITLVILGHTLEATSGGWEDPQIRIPLTAIYLFHMPLFVFLAGTTAKPVGTARRASGFILLLVVLQVAYVAVLRVAAPETIGNPLAPYYVLWFLMALAWWTLLTPLIAKLGHVALPASVVVALTSGMIPVDGAWFAVSRTLVFLPFFVAGQLWGPHAVTRIQAMSWRVKAPVVGAAALVVAGVYASDVGPAWLWASATFGDLDGSTASNIVTRGLLLGGSTIVAVAALAVMPATWPLAETVGRRSLAVFTLQVAPLRVFGYVAALALTGGPLWVWILVDLAATALIVAVLSWPPLDRTLRWIVASPARVLDRPREVRTG